MVTFKKNKEGHRKSTEIVHLDNNQDHGELDVLPADNDDNLTTELACVDGSDIDTQPILGPSSATDVNESESDSGQ